jgi:hypothetical protein
VAIDSWWRRLVKGCKEKEGFGIKMMILNFQKLINFSVIRINLNAYKFIKIQI